MQPPQSFLSTMEEYVREAPRAGATLMLKNEPVSFRRFYFFNFFYHFDVKDFLPQIPTRHVGYS